MAQIRPCLTLSCRHRWADSSQRRATEEFEKREERLSSAMRHGRVSWYADLRANLHVARIKVGHPANPHSHPAARISPLAPDVAATLRQKEEREEVSQRADEAFRRARAEAIAAQRQPLRLVAGVPDPWGFGRKREAPRHKDMDASGKGQPLSPTQVRTSGAGGRV
jgi:hypothetical protein